jgi:hypothetical protein
MWCCLTCESSFSSRFSLCCDVVKKNLLRGAQQNGVLLPYVIRITKPTAGSEPVVAENEEDALAEIVTLAGPVTLVVLTLVGRLKAAQGRIGVWEVLREVARGRSAAVAEREWRATTVEVLDRLPAGGGLDMVDDRGHRRTYRVLTCNDMAP